jgi:hypothetical protein
MNDYNVPPRTQRICENQIEGVASVQDGKVSINVKDIDCWNVKDIDCWHCCKKGQYYRGDCPELKVKGVAKGVQHFTMDSMEDIEEGHGLH